jgi:hypothetical protein
MFPGAFQKRGGHWRFPLKAVLQAKPGMAAINERNESGDLAPPDLEDNA